mmetsp:Transcript_43548/g.68173  ORF Transcript_43548/g.68173 Transcript_43548/m.68173 type:complete len:224 (-) Transcript_43548:252-923(-)
MTLTCGLGRLMCLSFIAWGGYQFFYACVDAGAGEDVWMESWTFNSREQSGFRILNFLFFCAHQGIGLWAHQKRNVEKADLYFWGWVAYSVLCLGLELQRLSGIESDAAQYSAQQCERCIGSIVNATSCEEPDVLACSVAEANQFKGYAYFGSLVSMCLGLALNCYFALVARSYWYYLQDDKFIALGQSMDECLTPLEQQAMGGGVDADVYVRMETGGAEEDSS